jgi:hypothetical protein
VKYPLLINLKKENEKTKYTLKEIFVSRIYKESCNSTIQLKMGKRYKQRHHHKDMEMEKKHKRCSVQADLRKIKIKTKI